MAFTLRHPATPEEAVSLVAGAPRDAIAVLAGGTDLLADLDQGRARPTEVLSLARLPWRFLTWKGDSLTIGSTLPLRELEADARVRDRLPGLYEAVRAVGGVSLRHRATLGGNVARAAPASDLLPILLAYDAIVHLLGPKGPRAVPLDQLLASSRRPALLRGELIESVTIPHAADSAYSWQRVRPANDVSQVGVAVVRSETRPLWRVALGGVPPRAVRLQSVERRLARADPTEAEIELAAQEAAAAAPFVTDKRATESFRRRVVTVLVRRAITTLAARSAGRGTRR